MNRDGAGPRGERDRRGRVATATAFFVQGLCFAVVVTRVSVLQDKFHLSNGQLTIVLLIVPVIAGVGSVARPAGGPVRQRHRAARGPAGGLPHPPGHRVRQHAR